ncbi:unnamed protein product [Protopolystoma xenopodis]|uniref:Uncharacterized protein n=1 Tax=Protopolystoma xenopodis TaxID=117903 RepID=A0A3S5AR13_9PLAT|nr:unnamed protein product [Protopolystoma xenopodis]
MGFVAKVLLTGPRSDWLKGPIRTSLPIGCHRSSGRRLTVGLIEAPFGVGACSFSYRLKVICVYMRLSTFACRSLWAGQLSSLASERDLHHVKSCAGNSSHETWPNIRLVWLRVCWFAVAGLFGVRVECFFSKQKPFRVYGKNNSASMSRSVFVA